MKYQKMDCPVIIIQTLALPFILSSAPLALPLEGTNRFFNQSTLVQSRSLPLGIVIVLVQHRNIMARRSKSPSSFEAVDEPFGYEGFEPLSMAPPSHNNEYEMMIDQPDSDTTNPILSVPEGTHILAPGEDGSFAEIHNLDSATHVPSHTMNGNFSGFPECNEFAVQYPNQNFAGNNVFAGSDAAVEGNEFVQSSYVHESDYQHGESLSHQYDQYEGRASSSTLQNTGKQVATQTVVFYSLNHDATVDHEAGVPDSERRQDASDVQMAIGSSLPNRDAEGDYDIAETANLKQDAEEAVPADANNDADAPAEKTADERFTALFQKQPRNKAGSSAPKPPRSRPRPSVPQDLNSTTSTDANGRRQHTDKMGNVKAGPAHKLKW